MRSLSDIALDYAGLTDEQAEAGLNTYGLNIVENCYDSPEKHKLHSGAINVPFAKSVLGVFLSFRLLLLFGGAVLYAALGELLPAAALFLLALAYIIIEIRRVMFAEEVGLTLGQRFSLMYNVVRNSKPVQVNAEHLVPEDVLILSAGDKVPADALILESEDFSVTEAAEPGMIYSGTCVIGGHCVARVTATGVDAKMHSGHSEAYNDKNINNANKIREEKMVSHVFPFCSLAGLVVMGVSALLFVFNWDGNDLNTLLLNIPQVIALGLCFIPARTDTFISHLFAKGAGALTRADVGIVIKTPDVVKTLASVDMVIADKSRDVMGSDMTLSDLFTTNRNMLTRILVMSCDFSGASNHHEVTAGDKAIFSFAVDSEFDVKSLLGNELVCDYPLADSGGELCGRLWQMGESRLLCVKGDPDKILALCECTEEQMLAAKTRQREFSAEGHIVIAAAYALLQNDAEIPQSLLGQSYKYAGLAAFSESVRDDCLQAIRDFDRAGVNVVFASDDTPDTAAAIARIIGIKDLNVVTEAELSLAEKSGGILALKNSGVFARLGDKGRVSLFAMQKRAGKNTAFIASDDSETTFSCAKEAAICAVSSDVSADCTALTDLANVLLPVGHLSALVSAHVSAKRIRAAAGFALSLSVMAAVSAILATLASFFFGTVVSAQWLGLLLVIVVPALMGVYTLTITTNAHDSANTAAIPLRTIVLRAVCRAVGVSVPCLIAILFFGAETALIAAIVTAGLSVAAFSGTSERRHVFSLLSRAGSLSKRNLITPAAVTAVTWIAVYIPGLNTMLGFAPVSVLRLLLFSGFAAAVQCALDIFFKRKK